ncbi:MAG TPA: M48 family metallopeptidase [Patescibacteria group bacterium]|nr:M48 family metallopeptidase [Patescibacteria group bacterium]
MSKPVYPNERVLLAIAALISLAIWALLALKTNGIIFAVLPFFYLVYLFAQSAFISYLRGTGALVSMAQFPDIQARVEFCAEKTGLKVTPRVYILNGNGSFNAYATKFLRRTYIVLLSDVVDACEDKPEALNFYIGHEMGHIDRKHLLLQPFLAPALCLPLLGAAYSRAREYTCDMYGALCCAPEAAQQGLAILGVGPKRYKNLNIGEYLAQSGETSGFWMSFHELIGSYPWLVKRYARISPNGTEAIPSRNIFAFVFAAFVPRLTVTSVIVLYFLFIAFAAQGMGSFLSKLGIPLKDQQVERFDESTVPDEAPQPSDYTVGELYDMPDGTVQKYLGGNPEDAKSWQPVTETPQEAAPPAQ